MLNVHRVRFCFNLFRTYAFFLIIILIIAYLIKQRIKKDQTIEFYKECKPDPAAYHSRYLIPTLKIYGIEPHDGTLDVVRDIFDKLGYRIEYDTLQWEVLWSQTYPFNSLHKELIHLKPHQKVNHFPGTGYITQKPNLVALPIKHMPMSFVLPHQKDEFLKIAKQNRKKLWILKSSTHRGIKILNGTVDRIQNGNFVQEFIETPLLINGRKFDIGIYVMLTSIDPLRVYVYSSDILLRFCKETYYPLKLDAPNSYIVGDDYLPVWNVPDLQLYFTTLNYTAKETLNAYLHSKGKIVENLWAQIYETIQDVYYLAEEDIKRSTLAFGTLRNFFELVRFDFITDENLNVFLMEVNMSPNLSPAHFPKNQLLYEQVVFNSLNLVGLARKFPASYIYRGELEVSQKDIQIFVDKCASDVCLKSCQNLACQICSRCMNNEHMQITVTSYLEFLNRGKYRRVIPPSKRSKESKRTSSEMNTFMDLWFKGKCIQDESWCS